MSEGTRTPSTTRTALPTAPSSADSRSQRTDAHCSSCGAAGEGEGSSVASYRGASTVAPTPHHSNSPSSAATTREGTANTAILGEEGDGAAVARRPSLPSPSPLPTQHARHHRHFARHPPPQPSASPVPFPTAVSVGVSGANEPTTSVASGGGRELFPSHDGGASLSRIPMPQRPFLLDVRDTLQSTMIPCEVYRSLCLRFGVRPNKGFATWLEQAVSLAPALSDGGDGEDAPHIIYRYGGAACSGGDAPLLNGAALSPSPPPAQSLAVRSLPLRGTIATDSTAASTNTCTSTSAAGSVCVLFTPKRHLFRYAALQPQEGEREGPLPLALVGPQQQAPPSPLDAAISLSGSLRADEDGTAGAVTVVPAADASLTSEQGDDGGCDADGEPRPPTTKPDPSGRLGGCAPLTAAAAVRGPVVSIELDFGGARYIGPVGAKAVFSFVLHTPFVRALSLRGNALDNGSVAAMVQTLDGAAPWLRSVDLSDNKGITAVGGSLLLAFATHNAWVARIDLAGTSVPVGQQRAITAACGRNTAMGSAERARRCEAQMAAVGGGIGRLCYDPPRPQQQHQLYGPAACPLKVAGTTAPLGAAAGGGAVSDHSRRRSGNTTHNRRRSSMPCGLQDLFTAAGIMQQGEGDEVNDCAEWVGGNGPRTPPPPAPANPLAGGPPMPTRILTIAADILGNDEELIRQNVQGYVLNRRGTPTPRPSAAPSVAVSVDASTAVRVGGRGTPLPSVGVGGTSPPQQRQDPLRAFPGLCMLYEVARDLEEEEE